MGSVFFPMYDVLAIRGLTQRWAELLAGGLAQRGLGAGAREVYWPTDLESAWRDPDLLLSQCCGYAIAFDEPAGLDVLAVPAYDFPGCEGPNYRSVLLVREDEKGESLSEFRGTKFAYNQKNSHSGYTVLRHELAKIQATSPSFFSKAFATGSHAASIAAVQKKDADLSCVDCVSYGLLKRHCPDSVEGLRVLAWSDSSLALPYVTSERYASFRRLLLEILEYAFSTPEHRELRAELGLVGFFSKRNSDFQSHRVMAQNATNTGVTGL
ncbi:MAG: PhnD/SsuA/transferrin family substrate-binding protein [Myxococcales bacterium]|nr:MAG: PhnD/SsuA/transferrin family substrate-binding protein [Myxococcales bacterium]